MADLFRKLNVLVKSSLNDLVGDVATPRRRVSPERLGPGIDREIAMLRGRINDAVEFENGLRRRVGELQAEVDRWDAQADAALEAGDEVNARYAVEQNQRAIQRLTMAQNDLRDHQFVTQELIQRVNTLEAVVADARRAQSPPAPAAEPEPIRGPMLSDVLRDARERVTQMGVLLAAKDEVAASTDPPSSPADEQAVTDDLARRRQRLSK